MVNIVIAPDIHTCDRLALQGAFVVIDGYDKKSAGRHRAAPRGGMRVLFAAKRRRHAGRISMWLRNASAMCKS